MNIGISTSCFYPLETEEALKLIAKNPNIQCAEIFYNSERELKPFFTDYLKSIAQNGNLKISALHPMSSCFEPYMIFSEYTRRFEDARDLYKKYYEAAFELGAKYVILHGDYKTGKLSAEEYSERFYLMNSDAKEFGVTLCQENVNKFRCADKEFISELVDILDDDISFVLDIKQCIRSGHNPFDIMKTMGTKRIKHIHISDHSLSCDCLLPLSGKFNFKGFFELLRAENYQGDCIIEVYKNAYKEYDEIFNSYNKLLNEV